jgi:hypothetical protein
MKQAYIIQTGELVSLLKDLGERTRILHDSGEAETVDKRELAQQAELCNVQAPTAQDLYDIEQDRREREMETPDLETLPIFGMEMNASEQLSLFQGV